MQKPQKLRRVADAFALDTTLFDFYYPTRPRKVELYIRFVSQQRGSVGRLIPI
jgi:hypothetical protein